MKGKEQDRFPAVSQFNFVPEVREKMFLPERVYVTDETLREGEETPGAIMTVENKVRIAKFLEKIGTAETNIGYVCNIEDHAEVSRRVKRECKRIKTNCMLRIYGEKTDFKDRVKFALDTGADRIILIVPISEYQFKAREGLSKSKVLEDAIVALQKARECGAKVTFGPYDTTRTDLDFFKVMLKTGIAEGADRVVAYDTLGVMTPQSIFYWMREIKKTVGKIPVQFHGHNDFQLAVANTCAAVTAGAEYIDIAVNGLGDRGGNANFEETVLSLEALYRVNTGIDTTGLFELSKLVENISGIPSQPNKPVTGYNTFVHESDVHVSAVLTGHADTFEPYEPSLVGQKRVIWFGSSTSLDSLETLIKTMNVKLTDSQIKAVQKRIRARVDEAKYATDEEVRSFISAVK